MNQLKNLKGCDYYTEIENDARNILNVPLSIKDDKFIVNAINVNSFVIDFLSDVELNNKVIAFYIALNIKNHRKYISKLLEDKDFYKQYYKQKLINKSNDFYLNKEFVNNKEFINEIINEIGYFKIKYLGEDLIKDENFIYPFLKDNIKNELWLPTDIINEAKNINVSPGSYLIKKIEYEILNNEIKKNNNENKIKKI